MMSEQVKLDSDIVKHPLFYSTLIHVLFVLLFIILTQKTKNTNQVEQNDILVPIINAPIKLNEPEKLMAVKSVNKITENPKANVREVFGLSRNSQTDESSSIQVKKGNTVTKKIDDLVLNDDDVDALPVPVEEYLVSQMPRILKEVKADYPPEAKAKGLEASIEFDILIDQAGKVREMVIVNGHPIFNDSASKAIRQFEFYPAQVDGKAVSVKIRYKLHFKLEY